MADAVSACVHCGFCLAACPTYQALGQEMDSPRGRIVLMKEVLEGNLPFAEAQPHVDRCLGCLACEPACPSAVPYGRMIESATSDLAEAGLVTPTWVRWALRALRHRWLLRASRPFVVAAQRLRLVPARAGVPRLAWRVGPRLRGVRSGPDLWIFTGCVMDVWQRDTHRSLAEIVERLGLTYGVPTRDGSCCGALHAHAGLHTASVRLAESVMRSMPGDAPIVVDSAGCGAAMKEYGRTVGTERARAFSARVVDAVEWLAERLQDDDTARRLAPRDGERPTVVIQDPCHHRHVQKVHEATRRVLRDRASIVEVPDDGLCCGAGGAFSIVHPHVADNVRARKVAAIESASAGRPDVVVASANPGCSMFLAAAGLNTRHPVDIVRDSVLGPRTLTTAADDHGRKNHGS